MADREMTPQEAIIVLDRLNTSERIEVDRDELRAAVVVCKNATRKQISEVPLTSGKDEQDWFVCPRCKNLICTISDAVYWRVKPPYCEDCGQALDWGEI